MTQPTHFACTFTMTNLQPSKRLHMQDMSHLSRVGQNHIYIRCTVYVRYFWQGDDQIRPFYKVHIYGSGQPYICPIVVSVMDTIHKANTHTLHTRNTQIQAFTIVINTHTFTHTHTHTHTHTRSRFSATHTPHQTFKRASHLSSHQHRPQINLLPPPI